MFPKGSANKERDLKKRLRLRISQLHKLFNPKPTQECSVIYNQHPPPGPSAEVINENSKANRLFASLLDQITNASRLLENNVEEVLRNGTRQCHEDPRIEDIGKLVGPTVYDELRFILGCLTLSDDFEQFQKPANGRRKVHTSQRAFGVTLGFNDTHAGNLRYGIDCGRKIRKLVLNCGYAVIVFLLFVKWHRAEEQEMKKFGILCGADEKIKKLIPVAQRFMTKCFDVYPLVLHERRTGKSKQPISRKRKQSITEISVTSHDTDRLPWPSHSMSGLSVEANSTSQPLSVTPVSMERDFGTGVVETDVFVFAKQPTNAGLYPPRASDAYDLDSTLFAVQDSDAFDLDATLFTPQMSKSSTFNTDLYFQPALS